MGDPNPTSPKDYEDDIRDLLRDETELTHHRMSWLGTFQGFLFAGLGFSWRLPENSPAIAICCLGIAVAGLTYVAILTASLGTRNRLRWWREHRPVHFDGPPMLGYGPDNPDSLGILFPMWNFIPLVLCFAWFVLFVIRVRYYVH